MCGIAGWLTVRPMVENADAVLTRMTDAIAHRGPDGSGAWRGSQAMLGHRRLSIVDLSGGGQPMATPDNQVVVTFNGEIYNHEDLRRDLAGHATFHTRSDTEVLTWGYRRWGRELPRKLTGMFAFCVWDESTRTAFIARDRMGKKPLYYAHMADGTLVFASELKAILEYPGIERRINPLAMAMYLTYEYVPWPHSAIVGIHKLPPGHWLEWKDGRIETGSFYELPFGEPTALSRPDEFFDAIRQSLSDSVKRRLMSDVPLGVFLSGGIDSSAITALMADHVPAGDIQTFSIAFEDKSFDESRWAQQVARHVGTHHRERLFGVSSLLEALPAVTATLDEPFADASVLPTYLLSCFTREHVTVALGGDGGDELFAGYETFRADAVAGWWRRFPGPMRAAVAAGVERMPVSTSNFSLDFVAKRFVRGAEASPEFRHTRWLSAFVPNSPTDPLRAEIRREIPDGRIYEVMARPYMECPDPRHIQRLSAMYMRTYMAEDILTKVDRASMATSLEVRSPFLDTEFISLVTRMPPELKLHPTLVAKYALKKSLEKDLPREILYRKKKGFGIPVAQWLKGPLKGEVDRLLSEERVREGGLFEPAVVNRLVSEHSTGRADHRKAIWTLMMFEYWRERFGATL